MPSAVRKTLGIAYAKLFGNRTRLWLLLDYLYDFRRFAHWSSAIATSLSRNQLAARITMDYHRIEKALALPQPRPGFGWDTALRLMANRERYLAAHGDDRLVQIATTTLANYVSFNRNSMPPGAQAETMRNQFGDTAAQQPSMIEINRQALADSAQLNYPAFVRSRHSIRSFDPAPVDPAIIESAVADAIYTPSVCNRQGWRAHVLTEMEDIRKALSYQNGNRGFNDQIRTLFIVSVDLQMFVASGERNQAFVDGGMFAMSLVYALHARGLGTCCLNWSAGRGQDRKLRAAIPLPESEVVIMMIACGAMPPHIKVTLSPRHPVEHILVWH